MDKVFRDFEGFRGLVIDQVSYAQCYRVVPVGKNREIGDIVTVTDEMYRESTEADVPEVMVAKMGRLTYLYRSLENGGYDRTNRYNEDKILREIAVEWERVFEDDELLSKSEFRSVYYNTIDSLTDGKLKAMGYKLGDSDVGDWTAAFIFKDFKIDNNLMRLYKKMKLIGLTSDEIDRDKKFQNIHTQFMESIEEEKFKFNSEIKVRAVGAYNEMVSMYKHGIVRHMFGVGIRSTPTTREYAKLIARNVASLEMGE